MTKNNNDNTVNKISSILESQGIHASNDEIINKYNNRQQVKIRNKKKNFLDDWINTSFLDDGFQLSDIPNTINATSSATINRLRRGVASIPEGILDAGANLIGMGLEGVGAKKAGKGFKDFAQTNLADYILPETEFEKKYSQMGSKANNLTEGLGQVSGNIALGVLTGGSSAATLGTIGVSSAGQGMNEAFASGATNKEALTYGAISGIAEAGSEALFGGLGKGVNALGIGKGLGELDDIVAKGISKDIKQKAVKNIVEAATKATGEGVEEVISGLAQAWGKSITFEKDKSFGEILEDEDLLDQFLMGFLTSGIAQSPTLVNSIQTNRDYITGNTDTEQRIVDAATNIRIAEQEKNGNKLTNKEKDKIAKQVQEDLERGYIDTKTIEDTLGFNEGYTKLKTDTENAIGRNVTTTEDTDIKAEARERFFKNIGQDDYLLRSYEELNKKFQNFNVSEEELNKMSDAEKKVYKDAIESGLDNTGRSHDFVKLIAKISSDKGINFEFSNNEKIANSSFALKNLETKINNMIEEKQNKLGRPLTENEIKDIRLQVASMVNGFENNGTITLNMNSSKTLSKVIGHEITHILEGTDMYDALAESVREYAKSKNDARLKDISDFNKMYSDVENANMSKELTADLVGDYIFTDQEFVNRLSTQNRNLFQKIFDEIKYMLRIATAGSKEARQLEKAKKMFEEAYRQNSVKIAEKQATTNKNNPQYSLKDIFGKKEKEYHTYEISEDYQNEVLEKTLNNLKNKNDIIFIDTSELGKIKEKMGYRTPEQYEALADSIREKGINRPVILSYNDGELNIKDGHHLVEIAKDLGLKYIPVKVSDNLAENIDKIQNEEYNGKYKDLLGKVEEIYGINQNTEGFNKSMPISENEYRNNNENLIPFGNRKTTEANDTIYAKIQEFNNRTRSNTGNSLYPGRGINESNTRFSLSQDNQGRELSKEQQEYFKDSKVRDENGNLMAMYHGTPNGDFTVFNPGSYFSNNQEYASGYENTWASSISSGKTATTPKTYEVYLNITNPFTITDENAKNIYLNEYIKGGNSLYYDPYTDYTNTINNLEEIDWTEGEDLKEWLQENHPEYDGLILDEGGDGGYGEAEYRWRGKSFVPFNSNQIKNVDNTNPTESNDIRYSLSVEQANTTEDNNGNKLSKEQINYFKNSKAVDENGNLITVYHTMTTRGEQFNEFNPVGTDYYKFGDQVVNYYTDSKDMSGSYADQDYVMADTKRITSMEEVNKLIEEHNKNLNPDEKYDYNLEIIKNEDGGYKLKVTSQPGQSYSGEIEEFYPRNYKDETDLYKRIKRDIKTYKTVRNKLGMVLPSDSRYQYEGYVNITNPYIVDAEERNWNQVISQSNDFIDELDERIPKSKKNELTALYQESANKSNDLKDEYELRQKYINEINEYLNTNENTAKMKRVVDRVGTEAIDAILSGTGRTSGGLGVSTYYTLADVLEQEDIIGKDTARLIVDDFIIPEQVEKWINNNYKKKLSLKDVYPKTNLLSKRFDDTKISLKDLYDAKNKAYNDFDKYRMPSDYFIERISAEDNPVSLGYDLNDMFETRAEIMGADAVAEEIAQAASVGFSKPEMIRLWGTSKTTNDVVKEIIASNKDGSTNYDGVIIKNVYDYGGKSKTKNANDLYITFNSNQFKALDNKTPTEDADIRYSLSDTGNTGSLMAMHSLNENNLKNIMTLGGIPAASIAVADTNNASVLNEFGGDNGYTLLFDKSSIDPKNKKNEVYNRDVYSKTVPTIYQKVDNRKLKNTLNEFGRYESEYGSFNKHDYSKSSLESIVNDLKYATAAKAKFLEDNGYNIDKVYRNYKSSYGFTEEVINKFIQDYPELAAFNPAAAEYTYEVTDKAPQIKQIAIDMMAESNPEIPKKSYEELFKNDWYLQDVMDFYRDINGYRRLNGQKEFDMYATRDNIDKAVDEHQEEFENWLTDKFAPLYGEKYFENESGTRKYDYTLENLTSYMTKGNTKAQQKGMFDTFSIGQAKAGAAQRYNTIEEIKEASKNLVDAKTYKERHEAFETLDESVRDVITDERLNNGEDLFDVYSDYYMALSKAASGVNPVRALENNYFNNMSPDQIDKFAEVANALKNLPAKYFEAKPQRAINLNEIKGIAAPTTGSESFKEQLRNNGYEVIEYDPSIEGDRERVINQFDDLKFSLSNGQEQTELATGSYNVPMKDYLVQEKPIQQVSKSISEIANRISELQQQIAEMGRPTQNADEQAITQQYAEAPMNEEAPIRQNLTADESEELDTLEDYFKEYKKKNDITNDTELKIDIMSANDNEKQLYNIYQDLLQKEQGIVEEETADDEIVSRGMSDKELGKRKVKSYQFEHPEIKKYFQEEARGLLTELNESTFGERAFDSDTYYETNGEYGWNGTKRNTSESLAKFKDNNNYTWEEIREGLEAIIEGNGAENNAVSKKLELVIDDRLRNGYKNFGLDQWLGDTTPPNQDYIRTLNQIQAEEALNEIPMSEVDTTQEIENNDGLMEAFKSANNEIKRLELSLALKDATGLEENLQANVDKIKDKIYKDANIMDLFYPQNRKSEYQAPDRPQITKSKARSFVDNLKGMFVNENVEIDNLARDYKRPDVKWAGDMLNNAFAEGQNDVTVAQTDNYGNAIGKSVEQLFQPSIDAGLYDAFNDYLINYSNIDRHLRGKGSNTPLNVSENLVKAYEKSYPEFKKWAEDVWNFGKNTRDNMLEAGLIDKNLYDNLGKAYPHYVPYISDVENINQYMQDVGELKPRGLKKAYGKAGKLLPVQEALSKYAFSMKKGIRQNALYNKIIDTLRSNETENLGTDDRTDYTNLDDGVYRDKNGAYLTAYKDGIARNIKISDDLYNGLKNDLKTQVKGIEERLSVLTNPLQKLSNIRRNILTSWSPTFPIKNALKDFQGALFNSKHTVKMLKNYPSAIKELATMSSPEARQFTALYGSGNLMGQFDEGSYKSLGKNKFLKGISKANEVIELAPRFAEFKASLESGASIEEAMYNAREVTTNFSRGGTITKALNRNGFTFLNSSVQGFDKFVRNFSGENGAKGVVSALLKATMFGVAPALFNDLVFGSGDDKDEDYEALPDYIKDNYYLIKTGDNKFIRIPKGREFSVFGSAARRALEAANGDENAFDGFLKNAWDQIGVGDLEQNNIIAPLLQAYGSKNGNAWYGGDIVPTRLQDKPAGEQTDSSIDAVSTWLGEKLGISPYKLNYVIDQYTGGIGDIVLPIITPEATSEGGVFAPISDQFTANSTMKNKYASEFYDKLDKLKVQNNSANATDEDALRYQYMSGISSEMGKLYAEKREIQASDLSKADKYAQVQEIQKQINELAKVGLEGYNNISAESNFAEVNDDMGYYKNSKGNWTAIPQTDIRETESIGLTDKEKSTYYQTKNSIYNITENYKEKSANATDEQKTILNAKKKADIISQIQKANLPDNGKAILYDKYYGSTDKINAVIDSEVNFDSYLDLQKQNFTADKDENGKAINGTKKSKVFNYINSMNIPYIEKCILAKLEYNSYKDSDSDIIQYLDNNPNISYDEMVDILKTMGFTVSGNTIK